MNLKGENKMKLKQLSKEEWALSIERCSNVTIFHTLDWFEVISETWPHLSVHLLSIEEDGQVLGLLPLIERRKFGLKFIGSPVRGHFTPYLGPVLISSSYSINYSDLLRSIIYKFAPDYVEISLPPKSNTDWGNFEYQRTLLLDLTKGEESIWKGMKGETRSQVRQAMKLGVEVFEPKRLKDWLPYYYAMVTATYSRQGLHNPAPQSFYENIWKHLYPKGILRVLLARHEEKIIAGGIFIILKGILYFLDGASFREYQNLRANNLIQWEIISWGAKTGLVTYDMVGANIPGIFRFKKGFGGEIVEYPTLLIHPTFWGRLAWNVYKHLKMPIKRLGIV
jgi:lipid II:glycine glycyltransferase (peptidoglycan interpeptide bridge formation enzyme)